MYYEGWFYSKKKTIFKCKFDEDEKKRYCSPQIDDDDKRFKKEQDVIMRNSIGIPHYIPYGIDEPDLLRDLGVKFGRYHVFLHKLIKPEPVILRTLRIYKS